MIYTRYKGVPIALSKKSGSFFATYAGRVFIGRGLTNIVEQLKCVIR